MPEGVACSIQKPVFLGATKFEVLREYKGVTGFFIRSFLINTTTNLNDWEVTARANQLDGETFLDRPGILFKKDGRRDHTSGRTKKESLDAQEPWRKADIVEVQGTNTGIKLMQVSRVTDVKTQHLIEIGDIKFVSPAIFPKSLADVEIIPIGPNRHVHRVHRYDGLHYAFVDDPAYGPEASIEHFCRGDSCLIKLQQQQAKAFEENNNYLQHNGIVDSSYIPELQENDIIMPGYVSVEDFDNEKQKNKDLEAKMTKIAGEVEKMKENDAANNPDEIKKEEARKAKKAQDEKKEKEEAAKKAKQGQDEKDEEIKKEAKKAEDEKKEKDMTARISAEISEKLPIIKNFVAAKTQVLQLDAKAQTELREEMMKASLEEVKKSWNDIKDFAAAIPMRDGGVIPPTESSIGYGAATGLSGTGADLTQYSAKSSDELLELLDE